MQRREEQRGRKRKFFGSVLFFWSRVVCFPLLDVLRKNVIFLRVAFCRGRVTFASALPFQTRFAFPSLFRVGASVFPFKSESEYRFALFPFNCQAFKAFAAQVRSLAPSTLTLLQPFRRRADEFLQSPIASGTSPNDRVERRGGNARFLLRAPPGVDVGIS